MNYDQQQDSLIQQIASLCYQIKYERGIDVFFSWHPHIAEVAYSTNGCEWTVDGPHPHRVAACLHRDGSIDALKAMRDHLQQMLDGSNEQDAMKGDE